MKNKFNSVRKRELLADLHFWQMQCRMVAKSLKSVRKKCKEVGAQLRELQKASRE